MVLGLGAAVAGASIAAAGTLGTSLSSWGGAAAPATIAVRGPRVEPTAASASATRATTATTAAEVSCEQLEHIGAPACAGIVLPEFPAPTAPPTTAPPRTTAPPTTAAPAPPPVPPTTPVTAAEEPIDCRDPDHWRTDECRPRFDDDHRGPGDGGDDWRDD